MMGEQLDLLVETIVMERLNYIGNSRMERTALFLQHAAVDDILCQRVLEAVFEVRKQARLKYVLGGLQAVLVEPAGGGRGHQRVEGVVVDPPRLHETGETLGRPVAVGELHRDAAGTALLVRRATADGV